MQAVNRSISKDEGKMKEHNNVGSDSEYQNLQSREREAFANGNIQGEAKVLKI